MEMPVKMSKKPTELARWLAEAEEKLRVTEEQLLAAQHRIRELEQEKTSRDSQDYIKAFLFCLLSVSLVCLARLSDWRTTLGLAAFCPSSSGFAITLWKFQACLCNLLQSDGGVLELFADIIWLLALSIGWNFVAHALSLCVLMDSFVDRQSTLIIVALVLLHGICRLVYGYITNISSQTNPAYEVDRYNGANEVASDGSVINRT